MYLRLTFYIYFWEAPFCQKKSKPLYPIVHINGFEGEAFCRLDVSTSQPKKVIWEGGGGHLIQSCIH
jgi:hypothetical protein